MSIVRVPFSLTGGGLGGYVPAGAIWLDGSADYLSWTPGGAADSDTIWTASAWVKRAGLGSLQRVFVAGDVATGNNYDAIYFEANDKLSWQFYRSGVLQGQYTTTAVFRDTSAWMHVHVTRSGATVTISVNGEAITAFDTSTAPDAGDQSMFMQSGEPTTISYQPWGGTNRYNGYIAEAIMLDGTASAVSNFGETDTNGNWVPINPSGLTFGTNGFWLDFADSADLGKPNGDTASEPSASGDWTGTNIASFSFADGKITQSTTNDIMIYSSQTFAGDFEIEFLPNNGTGDTVTFGVCESAETGNLNQSSSSGYAAGVTNGTWFSLWGDKAYIKSGGSLTDDASGGFSFAAGDKVKLTRTSGTLKVYVNDSLSHTFSQTNSNTMVMMRGGGNQGGVGYVTSEVQWADDGTLGNRFFLTGISSANATNDNPADDATNGYGNKAVANPLYYQPTAGRLTLSNGNRYWEATTGSYWQNAALTIPVSSGKFIVACSMGDLTSASVASGIGLSTIASFTPGTGGNAYPGGADFGSDSIGILDRSGVDFNELIHAISGTTTNTGTQLAADDQFVIALDADAGKAWLGWWDDSASQLNWFDSGGTSRSSDEPGSGTNATLTYTAGTQMLFSVFAIVASPTSLPSLLEEADWSFTKPTGFLELSTENLPAPTVTDPSAYFNTVLWNGDSNPIASGGQEITGVGFQPDFVWAKGRTGAGYWNVVFDAVRGTTKYISTNETIDELTNAETLDSFDADGFTVGSQSYVNNSASNFVGWCLKAGGSGSSNTDGTITSTVSVADHGGFGILTYTGNGVSGATLGTGMTIPSGTNALAIFKKTSAPNDWHVGYEIGGTIGGMELNNTTGNSGVSNAVTNFHSDSGTTITITSGGVVNDTGASYVAYVFQQIPGFCAIGSYTGNGSADGPYVVVDDGASGFRPAWVMIKRTDVANNWLIEDSVRSPYNQVEETLFADDSIAENTVDYALDFTANGFKIRDTTAGHNATGGTYIYLAFAEYPFGGEGISQARAR